MRAVVVTAPDDTRWSVRVAWEPRWRALARRYGGWRANKRGNRDVDGGDVIDGAVQMGDAVTTGSGGGGGGAVGGGGGVDAGDAIVVVVVALIAVIAAAVLFWWVLLPLLLLVLDLIVVLILLVLAIVGRVLFRRPWTVEATADSGEKITAQVVGWRAALRRRDEIADLLRQGRRPLDAASPIR